LAASAKHAYALETQEFWEHQEKLDVPGVEVVLLGADQQWPGVVAGSSCRVRFEREPVPNRFV